MIGLTRFLIATALATAPLAALAGDMVMAPNARPADKAFMDGMTTMSHAMDAVKPTGNTDKDFVAMMLPHHQGAVDMARVELRYGKDPVLLKMAADIVRSQNQEIATMKAWQAGTAR